MSAHIITDVMKHLLKKGTPSQVRIDSEQLLSLFSKMVITDSAASLTFLFGVVMKTSYETRI